MSDLTELRERLRQQRPVDWEQLPDFPLYMDQVLSYMHRTHLAYLTAICVLKHVMSTRDMDLLIREELQGERPIQDGYAAFCASLDKALRITADEMAARGGETSLADDAIHFALLSYAAGVASSRYVALLRQQKDAEAKKTKKERE